MSANRPITLCRPEDLTLEVFEQIVWDERALALHPDLLSHVAAARAGVVEALAKGRSVYGVNTGMGYLATVKLSQEEQARHQTNLLLGRAVGGAPYLDRDETRALLLARLAGFLTGHAGVTPQLCRFLADRLNDDFVPAIPRTGVGCAGEIIPLAHAFQTFLGVGQVICDGVIACEAMTELRERGVAPYRLESKEGIALLAGAPGAIALAAAHRRTAGALAGQLLTVAACAIDAMDAPLGPYDPAVAQLANDPIMERVLERLGQLLAGSQPERAETQAPVSFRVIPQVLAHLERTLSRLEEDLRRALTSIADSPVFVGGSFVSNGGFHAIDLAADLDYLCIALVQAGELAGQQIHRLLDHRFSGLPDQLTPEPGPQAGLVAVQKRVAGASNELRRLAPPASVGLADTSLGQEDAMTFGFEAAEKLRRAETLVREIVACELLVVRQAWALRRPDGGRPVASGLQGVFKKLSSVVRPVDHDRPLGTEIARLDELLTLGAFQ